MDLIIQELIRKNPKSRLDFELYKFGFNQTLLILLNLSITVLWGFLFGLTLESIVFIVSYLPIRSYAGGYHANTKLNCFIKSVLLTGIILLCISGLKTLNPFFFGSLFIINFMVLRLSPMESENKPITTEERKKYKKIVTKILIVENISFIISFLLQIKFLYIPIFVAITVETILLCLGKLGRYGKHKI